MSADMPAANRLSTELTVRCSFDRGGDISSVVDAARRDGATTATVALALVLYAQNAAFNSPNEGDRAALQTAGEIARLIAS